MRVREAPIAASIALARRQGQRRVEARGCRILSQTACSRWVQKPLGSRVSSAGCRLALASNGSSSLYIDTSHYEPRVAGRCKPPEGTLTCMERARLAAKSFVPGCGASKLDSTAPAATTRAAARPRPWHCCSRMPATGHGPILSFEPCVVDVGGVRGEIYLAQETDKAGDDRDHCAHKQCAGEPFQVDGEELLDEQGDDNYADEQRR